MDLVAILRNRVASLGEGDYSHGLKAVLLHIETAITHLSRGQDGENTAFTDAIYRTNQAFEGGIKEAYRVLTGKNPDKKNLAEIEKHLEKNNVFRSRVLKQFKTYRDEWRNPSTHDYKLDFDRHEAFLSIVTVTAFACLLFDQIEEKISFSKSQMKDIDIPKAMEGESLLDKIAGLVKEFCETVQFDNPIDASNSEILGTLHGIISATFPQVEVEIDAKLLPIDLYFTDMLLTRGGEKINIELKRTFSSEIVEQNVRTLEIYMILGQVRNSILMFFPRRPSDMEIDSVQLSGGQLRIVRPRLV